ncbi:biotin--[acetyl-CoA-carboxylase] ligase [Planctomyces sp. SH-PL62]|uniref:biotin--[acetyl-CoA-carboxylase] ligase n=1 Tax=Planctomyces sp. SH-PL62 TaxID=1636152 RepID=UPI00078C354B|nr:biotin--[acetyl-CoA-carboxylase] ligase [Planctomyces sp. SH-PL62]AMV40609.1 Bifunctional ligase/repressor BirA [Planctomyces sp. SH-PL62]
MSDSTPRSTWADPAPPALNAPLLDRLRESAGFVPLADLPGDPAAVAADLDALAAFGFALDRRADGAVAYRGPSPRLCPDQIEHALGTSRIGRRLAVWSRLGSTNDAAARGAESLANDGLVVMAEEQTSGRGRRGRSFVAPARSSLLMSVLLFPPAGLAPLGKDSTSGVAWLTIVGSIAVAELVAARTGREARIKWPNDVRVDGRKVCGVLVERAIRPTVSDGAGTAVVVGIGLNVNVAVEAFPPELRDKATSLRILAGRDFDRSDLARDLIRRLDRWYDAILREGPSALSPAWRALCEHLGRPVRITTATGALAGLLVDVDLELGLTLQPEPEAGRPAGIARIPLDAVVSLEPLPSSIVR